jgi:hypothetical protein
VDLARELGQGIHKLRPLLRLHRQAQEVREPRRQRDVGIDCRIDRASDLTDVPTEEGQLLDEVAELAMVAQVDIVGVIEQLHLVFHANDVGVEGSDDSARCRQQGVNSALGDVTVVHDLDRRSIECRDPGDIGLARRYRIDADEVGGGGREHEVAGDIERADPDRQTRRQSSAHHQDARRRSSDGEHAGGTHQHAAGRRDIAGDRQRAAGDDSGSRIGACAGERQRAGTDLDQRAAGAADNTAHLGREIVAADGELV